MQGKEPAQIPVSPTPPLTPFSHAVSPYSSPSKLALPLLDVSLHSRAGSLTPSSPDWYEIFTDPSQLSPADPGVSFLNQNSPKYMLHQIENS